LKPAPFLYFAPQTLDEALALLVEHGDEAKVLAGGQSLVPTMNFRLAQPGVLVDLNNITELFYLRPASDGGLRIGGMTRQRTLEREPMVAERAPLIHQTMPHIAHVQIRNRGTIGGSLAHADPAAELPAVALALDARFRLRNQRGERWINASEFYVGLFTTALKPDEILVEVAVPALPARTGWSIQEVARRHGDYAIVGVAATVTLDAQGRCQQTQIAGETPNAKVILAAAETAANDDIDPGSDIHASAAYRRHLANVLTRKALAKAVALATQEHP
jgi:carbon-monoxide dehydrogenase medium subunit